MVKKLFYGSSDEAVSTRCTSLRSSSSVSISELLLLAARRYYEAEWRTAEEGQSTDVWRFLSHLMICFMRADEINIEAMHFPASSKPHTSTLRSLSLIFNLSHALTENGRRHWNCGWLMDCVITFNETIRRFWEPKTRAVVFSPMQLHTRVGTSRDVPTCKQP